MDTQSERRRRMRAARALGGFASVKELAQAIPADANLGERTLRKLESGESELRPPAMREIAAACGVPYDFFTVDFSRLPELTQTSSAEPQPTMEERIRRLELALAAREWEELARSEEADREGQAQARPRR